MSRSLSPIRRWLGAAFATAAVAAVAVVANPGPAYADCPAPSWVGVIKTYHNGDYVPTGGMLNSNLPPIGSQLLYWQIDLLNTTDWFAVNGDVKPGTIVVVQFRNKFNQSQLIYQHSTEGARSNGVIHHENEVEPISRIFNGTLNVVAYAAWRDECDGQERVRYIGEISFN